MILKVVVSVVLAEKIKKVEKKMLQNVAGFSNPMFMPNKHADDKECVAVWIDSELAARLKKKAKAIGVTLTSLMVALFTNATSDISLTSKDYESIAQRIREKKAGRDLRSGSTKGKAGKTRNA
jgi:cell division protein ZapA (FtsZ GTPase activity inhibitor)